MTDVSPKGSEITGNSIVIEDPIRQFNFSEEFIKKRNKVIGTFFIIFLPVAFSLLWMTTTVNPKILVASFIITLIMIAILAVELRFRNKAMRQTTLLIYKDKIVKSFGKNRETSVKWLHIDKVKLLKNPKGNPLQVIIYRESKEIMQLFGFDRMEEIEDIIQRNLPTNTGIITKQLKLNPENPFWPILSGVICVVAISVVSFGWTKFEDIFDLLLMAGLATMAFIIKPFSKSNPNLRKLEIVIGLLAIMAIVFDLLGIL